MRSVNERPWRILLKSNYDAMSLVGSVANSAASAAAQRIGAALSDAQYFESNMIALEKIRQQLDSSSTKDKLDAMKRVIALISLGKDASTFFPEVVKNVAASSLEVKKLVYLYLVHYAEFKQDLALLAINSFQKDLSDPNQHIRALSLRVLSSIRVKIILQVVIHAIGKSAKDSSAYVRKAAAYAICKVCSLDSASKEALMDSLTDLISDRSTQVIGSAIVAFEEVCPDSFELIHPHYRRICRSLKSIDPWGQIAVMQMLLRYARANFADPNSGAVATNTSEDVDEADFYHNSAPGARRTRNRDLSLLLDNVQPLFYSLNNSVVMSAITVFYHLASLEEFSMHAIKPLMRLVGISDDGSQVVGLRLAAAVAVRHPSSLLPYISEFYVSSGHSAPVRELRMQVLNTMCQMAGDPRGLGSRPQARKELLLELQDYLFRSDKGLAAAGARAIGSLATAHPESTVVIVKLLSSVVSTAQDPSVVTESIGVLRGLLQRHPGAQTKALPQLIAMLLNSDPSDEKCGSITEPAARASIVWLIGEFYKYVQDVALEALRILVKGFSGEAAVVKLQILNLAAKLLACDLAEGNSFARSGSVGNVSVTTGVRQKLLEYVCTCARYDASYDVRDKSRVLQSLFLSEFVSPLRQKACTALLSKKPVKPVAADVNSNESIVDKDLPANFVLGSMSHILGESRLPGARRLRSWATEDSDAALREEAEGNNAVSFEREYTGISSASFGHMSSLPGGVSNSVWQPTNGVSSDSIQRDAVGRVIGFGQPSRGAEMANLFARPSHQGIDMSKIDPDTFYDSPPGEGQSSSEYETTSEEDGDEEDEEEEAMGTVTGSAAAAAAAAAAVSVADVAVVQSSNTASRSNGVRPPTGGASAPVSKAVSNYDIEALLGSLVVDKSNRSNTAGQVRIGSNGNVHQRNTGSRNWRRAVESWNAGGIEVDFCFSKTVSSRGSDWTPTFFRLTNRLASAAKEVKVVSDSERCLSCDSKAINKMEPGAIVELSAHSKFQGKISTIKFSVEVNGKPYKSGSLRPNAGEVLRPNPGMTQAEFLAKEKSLRGMFGSDAKFELQLSALTSNMQLTRHIEDIVSKSAFVACLGNDTLSANLSRMEDSVLFAGYLPALDALDLISEKRPVLLRITLTRRQADQKSEIKLWIGCEDVLFATNLKQMIGRELLALPSLA